MPDSEWRILLMAPAISPSSFVMFATDSWAGIGVAGSKITVKRTSMRLMELRFTVNGTAMGLIELHFTVEITSMSLVVVFFTGARSAMNLVEVRAR